MSSKFTLRCVFSYECLIQFKTQNSLACRRKALLKTLLTAWCCRRGAIARLEGFTTAAGIGCIGVAELEAAFHQAFKKINHNTLQQRRTFGIDINADFALLFDQVIWLRSVSNINGVFIAIAAAITNANPNAFFERRVCTALQKGTEAKFCFFSQGNSHGGSPY